MMIVKNMSWSGMCFAWGSVDIHNREQNISSVTFMLAGPGLSQRAVRDCTAREREHSGATNINTHI